MLLVWARKQHKLLSNHGFGLLEILVSIVIMGLISLGLAYSMATSFKVSNRTVHHAVAAQLAQETMEDYFSIDPQSLDDTDDFTDTVTYDGDSYTRTVDITVNTDRSRTVEISIIGVNSLLGGSATVSNSFALWGLR